MTTQKYTPDDYRVRLWYSCAYAWRTEDRDDDTDLSQLRADQAAEFDRWITEHDRAIRVTATFWAFREAARLIAAEFTPQPEPDWRNVHERLLIASAIRADGTDGSAQ